MKNKLKRLLRHALLYSGFIFVIYTVLQSSNRIEIKVFLVLSMVFILCANMLYDYLKHLNEQCQIALVVDCDFNRVNELTARIKRFDVFKGMKPSLLLTQLLLCLDQNNPKAVIQAIDDNHKFFTGHPDYLLIQYYSLFKAYALLGNQEKTEEHYHNLQRFKQPGKKKKSVSQLYNWDEIDGILYRVSGQSKKGLRSLQNVNTKVLNNRELIHYLYERALIDIDLKKKSNLQGYIKQIKGLNPHSPFIEALYEAI